MAKIAYIGNDMQFGIPLLIVLGSLFSTWTTTFLTFTLTTRPFYWRLDSPMLVPLTITLFTVLGSNVAALYYGVKLNNTKLVCTWYTVKIIECVSIVVAISFNGIHTSAFTPWSFDFCILTGLPLLPFGVYLILCVKKIYKNMTSPNSIYQATIIEPTINPKI